MQFALTGDDIINLNVAPNLSNDLADGTCGTLTVPNDSVNMQIGKNGNALYALDENGRKFELEVRIVKGAASDEALLNKFAAMKANFAETTFITGQVVKRLGDGSGNVKNYVYTLGGGVIRKLPDITTNVNGDVEQNVTVFNIIGTITAFGIE